MNYWQGKKIRLRGLEPEDYEFFYNWNQETGTQKNLDQIWFPSSKEGQKAFTQNASLQKGENDQQFLVIETLKGEMVGSISANSAKPKNGSFRYGVAVIEPARQKGYAREAIQMLLRYYFNELRYHKVNAAVYAFNESSIILHQKLGFQKEGQLREVIYSNGRYWDEIIFGMTKDEFNTLDHGDSKTKFV